MELSYSLVSTMHNTNYVNSANRLNQSYATIYSAKSSNCWEISISDVIFLVLGGIAFWLSLPTLFGLIIGFFYRPKIEAFFPPNLHYSRE
jgi:hypothetical protein